MLASLQPSLERRRMAALRWRSLRRLSRKRRTTVVTLIHRQETMSLVGFPLVRYIDVDDAESVLRAIRDTPKGEPIEIILHTPGGPRRQPDRRRAGRSGRSRDRRRPHYAMSGGTLIALAADEIASSTHTPCSARRPPARRVPGGVDRRDRRTTRPARGPLILADVAHKALVRTEHVTRQLLKRHIPHDRPRHRAPAGDRALDARPSAACARHQGARPAAARRRA
jgi:Serine dehydrogenase proteinase